MAKKGYFYLIAFAVGRCFVPFFFPFIYIIIEYINFLDPCEPCESIPFQPEMQLLNKENEENLITEFMRGNKQQVQLTVVSPERYVKYWKIWYLKIP